MNVRSMDSALFNGGLAVPSTVHGGQTYRLGKAGGSKRLQPSAISMASRPNRMFGTKLEKLSRERPRVMVSEGQGMIAQPTRA